MDLGLKGKSVVVTGGSKGIGFAAAEAFLKEGAKVAICSRHEEELKEAAEKLSQYGEVYYEDAYCRVSPWLRIHLPHQ